ncbi:MAG: hypothetical protein ISN28_13620 [Ectothiorhodospiraceae bacterium AqS1]|nr:hypothetical protein [Ectothiorhodospiraceae bacterium AqS1]
MPPSIPSPAPLEGRGYHEKGVEISAEKGCDERKSARIEEVEAWKKSRFEKLSFDERR